MTEEAVTAGPEGFAAAREQFATILGWLDGASSSGLDHAELENQLDLAGRELLRLLMQDHVDLRAVRESRVAVVGADGGCRTRVETGHTRVLGTVFGEITVTRIAYREPGRPNLHPADAALNLPVEKHSHGLRQLAAIESSRGSFDGAVEAIERGTGQHLGKRQVEDLAGRAAMDFDAFYRQRTPPSSDPDDVLALSCDGKGVVMRPDALRPATAKAAANTNPKLATRLSKGEKRNRKRMAEVGAVYDITPVPRCPADILPGNDTQRRQATAGPVARNKWLTASVVDDAATVVTTIFDEADRRDPEHARTWIALVDGNAPPDPAHQGRSQAAQHHRGNHHRLRARLGIHLEGCLVLPSGRRPRRRDLGPQARPDHPGRSPDPRRRRPATSRHPRRPRPQSP